MDASTPFTPAERRFGWFMRACAVGFAVTGAMFAARPVGTVASLNRLPGKSIPDPTERFWHSMSVAYMATIALAAWEAANNPRNPGLVPALLAAKATSSAAFATNYARSDQSAYLASAITDGSLFVATTVLAIAAARSRRRAAKA